MSELKNHLIEMQKKCDDFKYNFNNTDDKIREYCVTLRNQVDLETEKLIEQAHKFNESLIDEINYYEKECIYLCNDQICSYAKEYEIIADETNTFINDESKYLSEFKINNSNVFNWLEKVVVHQDRLILRDKLLKAVMFNGKLMEFKKNVTKLNYTILGKLTFKQLIYEPLNSEELKFDDQIVTDFYTHFSLFKLEIGNNVVFYIDNICFLNMVTFDNDGKVINKITNILVNMEIESIRIVKLIDTFIINVNSYSSLTSVQFHGNRTKSSMHTCFEANNLPFSNVAFVIDENANYLHHKVLNFVQLFMTANNSSILCIDSSYTYYYNDTHYNLEIGKSFDRIKKEVGQTVIDLGMNDRFIFIVCNTKKLKIFDIEKLDLVKEIDIIANQIKLVSTSHFVLFDSTSRLIQLYDQYSSFKRLHEVHLAQSIDSDLSIAHDRTNYLTFFNHKLMKSNIFG
jgi:hypothetical protein